MLLRVHCSDFHTQNTAASTSDAVELSESMQRNAYSDIGNRQPANAQSPCHARNQRERKNAESPNIVHRNLDRGLRTSSRTSTNARNQPNA